MLELLFRHVDGREFKIKDSEFSGQKLDKFAEQGFAFVGVYGESADVLRERYEKQFEQFNKTINPKPEQEKE